MPWAAVVAAAVTAVAEAQKAGNLDRAMSSVQYRTPDVDLERLSREHRARMEADAAKTLRDAKIGAALLIAFVVTALYGLAQLAGFV